MADSNETMTQDGAAPAGHKNLLLKTYCVSSGYKTQLPPAATLTLPLSRVCTDLTRYRLSAHRVSCGAARLRFASSLGFTAGRRNESGHVLRNSRALRCLFFSFFFIRQIGSGDGQTSQCNCYDPWRDQHPCCCIYYVVRTRICITLHL